MIGMRVRGLCAATDRRSGRKAVHDRHLAIHQHRIEVPRLQDIQRLAAMVRGVDRQAQRGQYAGGHFAIQRLILDHQHPARERRQTLHRQQYIGGGEGLGVLIGAAAQHPMQLAEAQAVW